MKDGLEDFKTGGKQHLRGQSNSPDKESKDLNYSNNIWNAEGETVSVLKERKALRRGLQLQLGINRVNEREREREREDIDTDLILMAVLLKYLSPTPRQHEQSRR